MNFKTRLFIILWVAGVAGVLSFLLVDLAALLAQLPMPAGMEMPPVTPAIKLLSLIQPTVLLSVAVLIGVALASKVGLSSPVAEAAAGNGQLGPALKPQIIPGFIGGLVGGVGIILNWFLWKPFLPPEFVARSVELNKLLPLPTRLLYGGFTEELLLRWGLMTLLVWAAWRLLQKGQDKPQRVYFIGAIIASSVIFGLGHLPFVFALVPDASVALILYVIAGNSIFGLVVGYLYWKKGLESAMIAHMLSHRMTSLPRTLGLRDLILLTIGSVIGSGIFLVPGAVLRQVDGFILPALLVWLVGGTLSLLGALTYSELGAMKPAAGGLYVYIRDCFGRFPAFLFGWTLFFVISSGAVATLAVAFSAYLGEIVPLTPLLAKLIAVLMIAVVTLVNVFGTRASADLQNWTTAAKVFGILLMSVVLLWLGRGFRGSGPALWPTQFSGSLASGFGLAMIGVLWAYEGWQFVTYSAGEVIDAKRNLPLGLVLGTAALVGIYLLANLGYLAALGATGVADSDRLAATAVSTVVSPAAAKLIAIMILISIFSAANGTMLTSPRVYYAMARDRLFFQRLAEVHPRFKTPAFAIIAGAVWSAILAVTGTFEQLLTYVVFIGWIFYALAAASIFVYRRRLPAAVRPYRVPGYPLTPLLFIAAAAALALNTIATQPARAGIGLGIVLLGAPAYLIWRTKSESVEQSSVKEESE
ncbi:MAG: amino acid permease [Acidobacteria bacterium]|nr:amino acid permease [Acidobacteriota bacterium]